MKMLKSTHLLIVLCMFCLNIGFAQDINNKKEAALKEALSWIELIDRSEFENGWNEGSEHLQKKTSQEEFVSAMKQLQTEVGPIVSRMPMSKRYETSLEGLPEGEYVIVVFNSESQNYEFVMENVFLVLEDDRWKTMDFHVKF